MSQVQSEPRHPELERVIKSALQHLEELGYSERTRRYFERAWVPLTRFVYEKSPLHIQLRDFEVGFLSSCGISPGRTRDLTWTQKEIRQRLRVLIEFQETGRFRRQHKQTEERRVPSLLRQDLESYEAFCKDHLHHCARTVSARRYALTRFLVFLGTRDVSSFSELDPELLSAFISERTHRIRPRTLATEVGCVRSLLRFLCMRGVVSADLLAHARALRFSKEHRLPPVWPPEVVNALLGAVDRSTNAGKRDYAILLLAARLGLRAGDIRGLELDNLQWAANRLTLTQSKTGRPLSLPLSEEIGQALIDYVRHARPRAPHREVFLKVRAPHEPLGPTNPLHSVMTSALRRANIPVPAGMPHGLHSLRHTLATNLVKAGQPLEIVSAILGHGSTESTRVYTHLDVNALRSVALDPEEMLHG